MHVCLFYSILFYSILLYLVESIFFNLILSLFPYSSTQICKYLNNSLTCYRMRVLTGILWTDASQVLQFSC